MNSPIAVNNTLLSVTNTLLADCRRAANRSRFSTAILYDSMRAAIGISTIGISTIGISTCSGTWSKTAPSSSGVIRDHGAYLSTECLVSQYLQRACAKPRAPLVPSLNETRQRRDLEYHSVFLLLFNFIVRRMNF